AVAVVDYRAEAARPYAGSAGFDDERFRAIAWSEQARSACVESSLTNHFLVADSPEADPAAISAPSLIVHSESDPLFPLPHGAALAQMIPNATLLRVDSMGHGTPPPHTWSVIVPPLTVHSLANAEAAPCRTPPAAGPPDQGPLAGRRTPPAPDLCRRGWTRPETPMILRLRATETRCKGSSTDSPTCGLTCDSSPSSSTARPTARSPTSAAVPVMPPGSWATSALTPSASTCPRPCSRSL